MYVQKILGKKSFHYPYIRVLPKMSDLKNHFIYNYNEQNLAEWKKCSTPFSSSAKDDKKILEDIILFLKKFNSKYTILENISYKKVKEEEVGEVFKEFKESDADRRVIFAMISNFQQRIEILKNHFESDSIIDVICGE